jgi:hypothetical protein
VRVSVLRSDSIYINNFFSSVFLDEGKDNSGLTCYINVRYTGKCVIRSRFPSASPFLLFAAVLNVQSFLDLNFLCLRAPF